MSKKGQRTNFFQTRKILKSKQRVAEFLNNNNIDLCNNKISDIRRIFSRWRDTLPEKIEKKLKISFIK